MDFACKLPFGEALSSPADRIEYRAVENLLASEEIAFPCSYLKLKELHEKGPLATW